MLWLLVTEKNIHNFQQYCLVSIAQFVGQCTIICRGRSSNPGHPTYSSYKVATRLPNKKKKLSTILRHLNETNIFIYFLREMRRIVVIIISMFFLFFGKILVFLLTCMWRWAISVTLMFQQSNVFACLNGYLASWDVWLTQEIHF